jgi:hypothetical protein
MPPQDRKDAPAYILEEVAVTIANGASLSGAADLYGFNLVGFRPDTAWDTNAMTFQGSVDGSTYTDVYYVNSSLVQTEYGITGVAASRGCDVNFLIFLPYKFIKVRSGTAGTPANQTGDTIIYLKCRLV